MTDTTRRTLLAGAAAAGAGLDLKPFVRPARAAGSPSAASVETLARIDAAARDVETRTAAFDGAVAQLEASLPPLHPDLIWRRGGRLPHSLCSIERRFDGKVVERGLNLHGLPGDRYVALPRLVASEIEQPTYKGRKSWERFLRQTLKRSRRYQMRLARAEAPATAAEEAMTEAKRRLDELVTEILGQPAITRDELAVKARALVAFTTADGETWRHCQAGPWGAQLAQEMLTLEGRIS